MTTSYYGTDDDKVDRISYLPRPIIHEILSLLPTKDGTRTSLLSKSFYADWMCFSTIDLDFYLFGLEFEEFIDYAVRTVKRRRIDSHLQKFQLQFPGADWIDNERQHRMDELISYAIKNKVKELFIDFLYVYEREEGYRHPLTVAGASSITKLTLIGATLNTDDFVYDWPQLVSLYIRDCSGPKSLKLSSSVIRYIELGPCKGLTSIEIESPSLETFYYQDSYIKSEGKIRLSNCKSLKNLSLCHAIFNDRWFSDNIHTFPLLEHLILADCRNLENPKVWNDNLKTIHVGGCPTLQSIEINSQNQQSLALELYQACKVNIGSCKHLRELSLEVDEIDHEGAQEFLDEILKEQVTKLIELEMLKLDIDLKFERIELKHECLKRLELRIWGGNGRHGIGEVVVDTPKLVSLNYNGCSTPFQLLNSDALLDTQLKIEGHNIQENDDYLINLWNLIGSVSQSRLLTLACYNEKYLIFPEEMKQKLCGRPVDNRDHLKVSFDCPEGISSELVDSLLWYWPSLKTLCLDERLIKFQHARNSEERNPTRCWRRSLRIVELNNFDAIDSDNLKKYFKDQAKYIHEVICN